MQLATAPAICKELQGPADELNAAVLEDGGPRSQAATDRFLTGFDAGCK